MKNIEQIKKELQAFGNKYDASPVALNAIKGNSLKELFENINEYIIWVKETPKREKEFNAIFNNELVIEDGILLCNCTNSTTITIPESVTAIGEGAFLGCKGLTSITIPKSVKLIEKWAFGYCSGLTSIIIPNSVTSIGRGAFAYCSRLTAITIPESVISIGDYAFNGCRENLKIIRK